MKKHTYRNRKAQEKRLNRIIIGVLIATAILLVVLIIVRQPASDQSAYIVTEDGHVHTADGVHLGMYDELFGNTAATDTPDETGEAATTAAPAETGEAEATDDPAATDESVSKEN